MVFPITLFCKELRATSRFKGKQDHNLAATCIFLIYSKFSNRNQVSPSSCKAYDKLITMTGKKGGVPVLVGELEPFFQLTELNIKANLPCF